MGDKHLPALDGVRGLAILLVMARHLSLLSMGSARDAPVIDQVVRSVAAIGWVGVDLFFVLSGFLITGILLDAKGRRGAFAMFWKRRALRIFPLYYAVCILMFFVLPHVGYFERDPGIATLSHNQLWYWLYWVNYLGVIKGSSAVAYNTGHFWSLAVEEQFYLAWPLVVLTVSTKTLWKVTIGMAVVAFIFRVGLILLLTNGAHAAYEVSPARMDILAAGAMVALAVRSPGMLEKVRRHALMSGAVVLALLIGISWIDPTGFSTANPYMATVGYSLLAIGGASLLTLVLSSADRHGWRRPFEDNMLRMFGTYSYCLYVVHYPLMILLDTLTPRLHIPRVMGSDLPEWCVYAALLFGLSLSVAWVSWRILERPMLSLKDRPAPNIKSLRMWTSRALPRSRS